MLDCFLFLARCHGRIYWEKKNAHPAAILLDIASLSIHLCSSSSLHVMICYEQVIRHRIKYSKYGGLVYLIQFK